MPWMMNLLFTPNHVQLLNACYPPSSMLLSSGPDFTPKGQELSRLTYYAYVNDVFNPVNDAELPGMKVESSEQTEQVRQ